jgi:beta-glucosidase
VDGKQIVDDWNDHAPRDVTARIHLEAGHKYQIKYEFYQALQGAETALVWTPPHREDYEEALDVARKSDVVVLALGISGGLENEELDRKTIELPDAQKGLLNAVLAVGKPVVVVLESGSCIAIDDKRIRGLVEAWYPGEAGGTAVAEVLFGKISPSGRLPITFYRSLDQVPPFRDYKMDRRTYRYLHADQKPLYPFGYGLSYARFKYSNAKFVPVPGADAQDGEASATVKNIGSVAADEVVQVYASRPGAAWPEPFRRLIGFKRVHLAPGESRTVKIRIPLEAMEMSDGDGNLSYVRGTYTLTIGGGQPGAEPATSGKSATTQIL